MPSRYSLHKQEWVNCTKCLLHEKRTKVVLVRGKLPCEVLFIGEAPGQNEDVIGQPFVGPAGKLLDQIIADALEGKFSYALTNLVGCIPIGDDGDKVAEPPEEAIRECAPRVADVYEMCQPQLIVGVGLLASKWIDRIIPHRDAKLVKVVHPAAILRMDVSQKGLAIQRTIMQIASALVPF